MLQLVRSAAWLLALVSLLTIVGCSSGTKATVDACGAAVREPLDSNLRHLLPGAPEPRYLTDPPTSGPHTPGALSSGVLSSPLSRPSQVGALEAGAVIVQYREQSDLAALASLATGKVVVVPNAGLATRVVATAWLYKLTCSAPDTTALARFAHDHGDHGPGTDSPKS